MADHPDHQERPLPFEDVITAFPAHVGAYRSTAVHVDNSGGAAATVRVTWYMHEAPSVSTHEDKTVAAGDATTLFFVNQGDTLDSVTVSGGGGGTTHSVSESNQLPLPASAAGAAVFALTGSPFSGIDGGTAPIILDDAAGGPMNFDTTAAATFDSSGGRARIRTTGAYVIGMQLQVFNTAVPAIDVWVTSELRYGGDIGYSIEVPHLGGGFDAGGAPLAGEELIGTRYAWQAGSQAHWDVVLQRLHPISLTGSTTFPLEIQPTIQTNSDVALTVQWAAVWGYRLSGPLDAYHSD